VFDSIEMNLRGIKVSTKKKHISDKNENSQSKKMAPRQSS
jgi:hypothetical protein